MTLAEIREIGPYDADDLSALGAEIIGHAIAAERRADAVALAMPFATRGIEKFQRYVQPIIAEIIFHQMSGLKPAKPGQARNAYKKARSTVWRARYNDNVSNMAVEGMCRGLEFAVTTVNARRLVRKVDEALSTPRP